MWGLQTPWIVSGVTTARVVPGHLQLTEQDVSGQGPCPGAPVARLWRPCWLCIARLKDEWVGDRVEGSDLRRPGGQRCA